MTLDQLRYFQAVCNYGSVIRAANFLNISQPSVSNAISNLEEEFGTKLFTRQNRKMTLTKEGALLLERTNDLLNSADDTVKLMKKLGDNQVLNLGVPPMLSSLILPIIYGSFSKSHPDFKINIIEDDRSGLVKRLDENKINMAFLPHQADFNDNYKSTFLTELNNVCCVQKNHPLSKKAAVRIEDLENEPLVLFKNSFFQTKRILERFAQSGYMPNILLDTAQVSTMQNIISEGLAVGFIFEFLLDNCANLVGVPLDPPMRTKVSLVWKRGEQLSGNMHQFIKFISDYSDIK